MTPAPHGGKPRPLRELIHPQQLVAVSGNQETPVLRMTHDSRQVGPGALFIAYRGVYLDVHRFIPDALARGAAAVLVERPIAELRAELGLAEDVPLVQVHDARAARSWAAAELFGHPSRHMTVVGVTGTDGKTTTSTLIHGLVSASGARSGLVSTVGAYTGAEDLPTGLHTTTPEAEEVHGLLAAMLGAGVEVGVLEVTSHGLHQHRVTDVAFDVAAITNITHEALEYHETMDAYRAAKARLFHLLLQSPAQPGLAKTAVLNAADLSFAQLSAIPVEQRLSYSAVGQADFTARGIRHGPQGLEFRAVTPVGAVYIRSPLLGYYNVANILAALAVAHALGLPREVWPEGVAATRGIPGRMELIHEGQPFLAVVDFAHTPNSLRQALDTARELLGPAGRVIAVFGCAGERDRFKRPMMGTVAGEMADLTFVTAEDPRSEPLDQIMSAVVDGLRRAGRRQGEQFWCIPDRAEAIRLACAEARDADVVIVLGKGHEQSMCFGDTEHAWDDRHALRAALTGRAYGDLPTSGGA